MDSTLDFVRGFGWLAGILLNLLICWIAWSLRHKFVTHEDWSQYREFQAKERDRILNILAEQEAAMKALTQRIQSIPDLERLHGIELKLAGMAGEQSRSAEELRGMRNILERVESQTTLLMRDRMEGAK